MRDVQEISHERDRLITVFVDHSKIHASTPSAAADACSWCFSRPGACDLKLQAVVTPRGATGRWEVLTIDGDISGGKRSLKVVGSRRAAIRLVERFFRRYGVTVMRKLRSLTA